MRTFLLRGFCVLIAALLVSSFLAVPAMAEEGEHREGGRHDGMNERDLKKVLKGLATGIAALRAIGGQERVIGHMKELMGELKKRHAQQRGDPKRRKGNAERQKRGAERQKRGVERQRMGNMIELMLMAHGVLREADRDEWAEIMEHGAHAMKMLWSGRSDDEAMRILSTAPSKERQVKALFLASEILADHGKKDRAHILFKLGREMQGKGRKESGRKESGRKESGRKERGRKAADRREEREEDTERRALRKRVEILRMAMPALREGERRDAAEMLERAIHTGELLLEGREDEEAQRIYRNTPKLAQLAEVLNLASRLWREFKHPEQAETVLKLSRYYAERARGDREEHGEREAHERERREAEKRRHDEEREMEKRERAARDRDERAERRREHERRVREHDGRGEEGTAEQIQQLQREMNEIQRALENLMRQLRELARERK